MVQVTIDRTADWWLGDLEGWYFKALERAVEAEWGVTPLRIREGGVSNYVLSCVLGDGAENLRSPSLLFHSLKRNSIALLFIFQWAKVRWVLFLSSL